METFAEGQLWETEEGGMKGSEVGWLRGTRTGMKGGFVLLSDSEQEAALCLCSRLQFEFIPRRDG